MTAIKFCGITREEDAEAAVALGASAVGFILWGGSARAITPEAAATIIRGLPPFITPVAVLVNPRPEDVARSVEGVGCRLVQVHGEVDEKPLAGPWQILRAVRLSDLAGETEPRVDAARPVLLDAHDAVHFGGTGRTIDWARAAAVASKRRVVLAGGLTPANVGTAVRVVRPYAVDVASGVECAPGIKDQAAMRAFVDAVRNET